MFTNEIRPYKSHAGHRKQTCDTLSVSQMGVLDVEPEDFMARNAVSISQRFLYVATPSSGRLKQIRI